MTWTTRFTGGGSYNIVKETSLFTGMSASEVQVQIVRISNYNDLMVMDFK